MFVFVSVGMLQVRVCVCGARARLLEIEVRSYGLIVVARYTFVSLVFGQSVTT